MYLVNLKMSVNSTVRECEGIDHVWEMPCKINVVMVKVTDARFFSESVIMETLIGSSKTCSIMY